MLAEFDETTLQVTIVRLAAICIKACREILLELPEIVETFGLCEIEALGDQTEMLVETLCQENRASPEKPT